MIVLDVWIVNSVVLVDELGIEEEFEIWNVYMVEEIEFDEDFEEYDRELNEMEFLEDGEVEI